MPLQSKEPNITVHKIAKTSNVTTPKSLDTLISERNLKIDPIIGDGACLFRALSFQMNGNQDQHLEYRKDISQFIERNYDEFVAYVDSLNDINTDDYSNEIYLKKTDAEKFQTYIQDLRKPETYGDDACIISFCKIHQVSVIVIQLNQEDIRFESANLKKTLYLLYDRSIRHYSSLSKVINDEIGNTSALQPDQNLIPKAVRGLAGLLTTMEEKGELSDDSDSNNGYFDNLIDKESSDLLKKNASENRAEIEQMNLAIEKRKNLITKNDKDLEVLRFWKENAETRVRINEKDRENAYNRIVRNIINEEKWNREMRYLRKNDPLIPINSYKDALG